MNTYSGRITCRWIHCIVYIDRLRNSYGITTTVCNTISPCYCYHSSITCCTCDIITYKCYSWITITVICLVCYYCYICCWYITETFNTDIRRITCCWIHCIVYIDRLSNSYRITTTICNTISPCYCYLSSITRNACNIITYPCYSWITITIICLVCHYCYIWIRYITETFNIDIRRITCRWIHCIFYCNRMYDIFTCISTSICNYIRSLNY